jgi:hypothetical protein
VRTRLALLAGQTIALGLMMAFLVVPVSALFLDEYGADMLPYVYLVVAAAGVAVSSGMSRAQRRFSLARLAAGVVGGYLLTVAAGWFVLVGSAEPWVTFPLLVLFPLSIPIGFVLVGSQAGRLLDVRQMKAHFPRVAAGFSVGFAIGGLAAAALVSPLGGPSNLLGFDVLAAAVMLGLVLATARAFPAELDAAPEPPDRQATTAGRGRRHRAWRDLVTNRMVALILGYQVLSAAVTLLLDYMVWERAAARYPDASALAQFQGLFGAVINVTSVLFVVVAAGWLLTRFGIGFGLAANPVGVLVLLVATTLVGYAAGPTTGLFFALVCAQAVTDISLTDGTTRTSINATYQALRPEERLRVQTMVEGAGVPLALGFVGVQLIVYDALGLDIRTVVVVTLLLTLLWLASAVLAFREYGVNLRDALSRRAWELVALRIDDAASHAAVDQLLSSSDPHDVHAALDALADTGRDVSEHLLALLADPDAARRTLGLQMAVATGRLDAPTVRARVDGLLADGDPGVALHAAAALVRLRKGQREVGRSAWIAAVATADAATVRRALAAAADLPHRFFVPYLVGLASSGSASADVLDALGAHSEHLASWVRELLGDPLVPRQTRERVVHFLGQSATGEARDLLVVHLDDGDPAIVEAAALCLVAVGHTESPERLDLAPKLIALAARVHRCLQVLALLDDGPDHEPLRLALRDEVATAARRAEVLVDLVHDPRAFGSAVSALASPEERSRNTALEMIEVTVGRSVARTTLALVDPTLDDAARQRMLAQRTPLPSRSLAEWLRELVLDEAGYWDEPWLRACAMYAVPSELPGAAATALVRPFLDSADRDVAETARWVTERWVAPERVGLDVPTSS